jgi:hypothetical protein
VSKIKLTKRVGSRAGACAAVAVLAAMLVGAAPTSAGILDFLFGGRAGVQPQRAMPPPPPAQPGFLFPFFGGLIAPPASNGSGPYVSYCVRLCDGRYFPMQRSVVAQSTQICQNLCPAARTLVFSGSEIAYATAIDGTRYERLENAFAYRQRIVPGCTCNGHDPFGLATMKIEDDPTLQPGDLVSTKDGIVRYTGYTRNMFTPIEVPPQPTRGRRRMSSDFTLPIELPE